MKKIIALILMAAMLLSFAACGGNQSASNGTDSSPVAETSDTPEPEATEEPPAETPDEPEEDEPEAPSEPVLGVYNADTNTYENELLGLGCQLEEDWQVYDDDQMAQLNGMLAEMMTDEAIAEQLESSGYVQAFYAQLGDQPINVNITVENLGLLYGAVLGEKEYAELSIGQLPAVLESIGLEDITTEITTTTFLGGEHTAINVHGLLQGTDFYETLVCLKVDRYMACVTAASYLADVTGEILDMFYAL